MAINPNIALSGQPMNIQQAIMGGLQTGEAIRNMGIRDALLRQQQTQGQQQIQSNQQGIQSNANALQQTRGRYVNQLATSLLQLPIDQRAGAVARAIPAMEQLGIPRSETVGQDLSDQGLQQIAAATRPFASPQGQGQTAGMQDFQFYQNILRDPNASAEQKQAARIELGLDSRAGRSQLIETGVPGVYQTYDPNTETISAPFRRDEQGNKVVLSRQEQLEQGLADRTQQIKTEGEAEEEVKASLAQTLAEIETAKERNQALTGNQVARMEEAIQKGITASGSIVNVNRGLELLERVSTGGLVANATVVSDFLGTTSADVGELRRNLAQNVLDGLKNFTGAISEGERQFLERIETNLSQGTAVNTRELERMRSLYIREMKKAMKAAELSGDEYALDVIGSALREQGVDYGQGSSNNQGRSGGADSEPSIEDLVNQYGGN